jgi:hypothetical protein
VVTFPFGSVTVFGNPHATSRVLVVACSAGLVVVTDETRPWVPWVKAVVVVRPSASPADVTRP